MSYIILFLAAINALFAIKGVILSWPVGTVLLNTVAAVMCTLSYHYLINR